MERLSDRRARFLMQAPHRQDLEKLVEPLKDAPLRVRRLGLPLAVAMWSREGHDALIRLLAQWLFDQWGMLPNYSVPQAGAPMVRMLTTVADEAPAVRSALEVEAEEFLQAAKLLSSALAGGRHD